MDQRDGRERLPSGALPTKRRGHASPWQRCLSAHLNLKSPKPDGRYPAQLQRLGDHIRKRRLDLRPRQRDLAWRLGADPATVINWEKGRTEPRLQFLPAIIDFLGADPRPVPKAFGNRLRRVPHGPGALDPFPRAEPPRCRRQYSLEVRRGAVPAYRETVATPR